MEYAALTAAVFASRGHRVALFRRMVPTPFVAAGVAELGAAAGVMVTASHNPKEYNGYKVSEGATDGFGARGHGCLVAMLL
jgi:phosphomannomutase